MAFVFPPGIALGPVTPTRGRSVVATQAFGPGDTIAIIPDTLSIAVPDTPHLALTCSYCLAVTSEVSNPLGSPGPSTPKIKVRACAGCKTSYYCSAACQKADWKLVHGLGECKTFKRVRDIVKGEEAKTAPPGEVTDGQWNVLPTPTRAIVQALLRPDVLAAIAEMEGHAEKEGADGKRPLLEFQARAILNYMHRQTTQKSMGETIDVICKVSAYMSEGLLDTRNSPLCFLFVYGHCSLGLMIIVENQLVQPDRRRYRPERRVFQPYGSNAEPFMHTKCLRAVHGTKSHLARVPGDQGRGRD